MQYRTLGRTGLKASALGFGCMRLPMEGGKVVDSLAIPMLRRAVELGVNYFDTAVGYCQNDSQRCVGDALRDVRSQVILSTKNPQKEMGKRDEWWRNLEGSLKLLRTDYIDIYNVHGLTWEAYEGNFAPRGGLLECLLQAREQGMIRHLCFSTHDTPKNIIKLADLDVFESVTLQYNLINRSNLPAIEHLASRNMGVVAMGPVGGGRLGDQTIEGKAGGATSAELALKFVLATPGITLALSGMSEMRHLEENYKIASQELSLTSAEAAEVDRAAKSQAAIKDYYCTACGYCMPCPSGVDVPANFTLAQVDQAYAMGDLARNQYAGMSGKARYCVECGECLDKCPQKLDIPGHMKRVVERLDPEFGKPALEMEIKNAVPEDGGLRFFAQITPINLTGGEIQGDLALQMGAREILRRSIVLKPRMHRRIKAEGVARAADTPGTVSFLATYEGGVGAPEARVEYKAIFAHKNASGAAIPPDQATIHGPARAVAGDRHLAATHRVRFRTAHDGTDLIFAADADEDLLGERANGGERDSLELYFDCRAQDSMRKGGYGPGCAVVRLTPDLNGGGTLEPKIGGGLDFSGARIVSNRTESGYRLEARIPLHGLKLAAGQKAMGFDVGQRSVDAEGKLDLHLLWAGGDRNARQTRGFGLLCLQ